MAESLFDCLSKSYIGFTLTDKWANGQFGGIVDIKGDGNYRFVDYGMDADGKPYKVHLTEEDEMTCPVVATGFVAYWLHNRNQRVKEIFEGYFTQQLQAYERAHEYDDDAWERDLKKEFVTQKHPYTEPEAIRTSEAIFPYLTENDVNRIQSITDNYLRFARKKRKELYPPNYPKGRELQETFLAPYRSRGAAMECLNWMRVEYNLPYNRPKPEEPTWKESLDGPSKIQHEVELRQKIREEFEDFDKNLLNSSHSNLMEEINKNLHACGTRDERLVYVATLVHSFQNFAEVFYPNARIRWSNEVIQELEQNREQWEKKADIDIDTETGQLKSRQEKLDEIDEWIQYYREDIKYYEEVQTRFLELAEHGWQEEFVEGEDPEMCKILGFWWWQMLSFAVHLAALALTYGIDIDYVQDQCQVYLKREFRLLNYVDEYYIATLEQAARMRLKAETMQAEASDENSDRSYNDAEPDQRITTDEATPQPEQFQTGKAQAKSPKRPKQEGKQANKPLVYYTLEYINDDSTKHIRIDYVQRKLEEWGWMGSKKNTEPYEKLFSGKNVDCKLKWKGSAATLYRLLRELLKQPFIKKHTGCSARSIVETQFDCGLNQHANDVKSIDKSRIDKIIFLLNPEMDLPTRGKGINESIDVSDSALAKAMARCGELHSSNRR